jgi:hypothetical protein
MLGLARSGVFYRKPRSPYPLGDAKASLHLAQSQNPAVRRQQPPSNLATTALPPTGDKTSQERHRIGYGRCGLAEIE